MIVLLAELSHLQESALCPINFEPLDALLPLNVTTKVSSLV